jgi:hypothetical protein
MTDRVFQGLEVVESAELARLRAIERAAKDTLIRFAVEKVLRLVQMSMELREDLELTITMSSSDRADPIATKARLEKFLELTEEGA